MVFCKSSSECTIRVTSSAMVFCNSLIRGLCKLLDQFPYGRLVQKGKGFNIVFGIFIRGVQPILVKLVGRGSGFVQPNIAASVFPNFVPSALVINGQVMAKALPPNLRRISLVPVVIFPIDHCPPFATCNPCFDRGAKNHSPEQLVGKLVKDIIHFGIAAEAFTESLAII